MTPEQNTSQREVRNYPERLIPHSSTGGGIPERIGVNGSKCLCRAYP